jgi:hypothetical protein
MLSTGKQRCKKRKLLATYGIDLLSKILVLAVSA